MAAAATAPEDADATGRTAAALEDEIAVTPNKIDMDMQALFVEDLHLLRHAPTRNTKGQTYAAQCAVTARKLVDTGAAPSIATTGFLALAPADCLVSRDRDAAVGPLVGPDGSPLRTEGTATVTFVLGGTTCRHTFVVVVGKPLLILGNEFLHPRKAVIRMNEDGQGQGSLEPVCF